MKLEHSIDLELWKKIQDNFANTINLPVYTIDEDGNELAVSRDFPFFCDLVKSKPTGKDMCKRCRVKHFEELKNKDNKIEMYLCPAGLLNIMVPIIIGKEQLGAVVCSSIVKNVRNYAACRNVASMIKIDTEELIEALNQIKVYNVEQIKTYATLMTVLSKTVPDLMHQKVMSEKKVSELTVLNKISNMVNSTLDTDKIMTAILNFLMQSVKAADSSIIVFKTKKRYGLHEPSAEMQFIEKKIASEIANTMTILKVHDFRRDFRFDRLKFPHKALLAFPLKVKDEIIGVINLYGESIDFNSDDIEFLSTIANQTSMAVANASAYKHIKESAITDKLTGLYNRRHFMELLENEIQRSQRFKSPLSVALFDIDDFKHYNDTQGHLKGDKLLAELSKIVTESVRTVDTVGRYGGEEFIVVLPETKSNEAKAVSERVRQAIEQKVFDGEEQQPSGRVTVSLGLVTVMNGSLSSEEMLKEADKNLYRAKAAGKNKVKANIFLDRNMHSIEVLD